MGDLRSTETSFRPKCRGDKILVKKATASRLFISMGEDTITSLSLPMSDANSRHLQTVKLAKPI